MSESSVLCDLMLATSAQINANELASTVWVYASHKKVIMVKLFSFVSRPYICCYLQ